MSKIDKALQKMDSKLTFKGEHIQMKRSTSGPAATLNVKWKKEELSIDIVVCLQAEDVGNT